MKTAKNATVMTSTTAKAMATITQNQNAVIRGHSTLIAPAVADDQAASACKWRRARRSTAIGTMPAPWITSRTFVSPTSSRPAGKSIPITDIVASDAALKVLRAQLGALKAAHAALLELDARVIGFPEVVP